LWAERRSQRGDIFVESAMETESGETRHADVKSFADKSIPVLEEHLKLITAIKKS
jgi:hypothetical protein